MTVVPNSAPVNLPDIGSLAEIDWDFPERMSHSGIEGIHPYPAKFVTELPRTLLKLLPLPRNTAVLDPFCGSGTTLVESQRLGVPSVGVDLNPIACLMTRVKTSPLPPEFGKWARRVASAARRVGEPEVPDIPRLDHWFNGQVQSALAALSTEISATPSVQQDALRLALSSIIVRVSNQESDTRYAAVDKGSTSEDVYRGFLRAAHGLEDALHDRDYPFAPATVIEGDVLETRHSDIGKRIGMVITSPPYPNAYEYWLYHKYRMYWLGYDPLRVRSREIGARAHFFKRNHHTADDFARQMQQTLQLIGQVMVREGFACFVIGRSRIHGQDVDNARVLEDVATAAGFERVFSAERVLAATRKSFNLSHANIRTETVLVLRRRSARCD
ncbi:MAG: site-specific DNA-methyltransferase [Boseongicola sp. SB0677_bin_26]|nr:site-specific DNA-methyltransferase [Boseongicola sp. SB0665_bin_10]MYG25063.1 site-specific DNA-methyltransferase [Boseongicola sp. SB0677_bin_26]